MNKIEQSIADKIFNNYLAEHTKIPKNWIKVELIKNGMQVIIDPNIQEQSNFYHCMLVMQYMSDGTNDIQSTGITFETITAIYKILENYFKER